MLDLITHPVIGLLLLLLTIWYWRESRRLHELTLAIVRRACQAQGLQLLDATIRLQSLRLNLKGDFSINRKYRFEFSSDGHQRQYGWVFLHGDRPHSMQLQTADGQLLFQSFDG